MLSNRPLQSGVAYMKPSSLGAYNASVNHNIDSYPFAEELSVGDVVPYGSFVVRGTNGVKLPAAGITAADIMGVVAYGNNGVLQDAGLVVGGLYQLVPVLNEGRIWVKVTSGASLQIGDVVSLNLASGANFGTVRPLPSSPASTDINISSIVRVAQPSNAEGMVEITFPKFLN